MLSTLRSTWVMAQNDYGTDLQDARHAPRLRPRAVVAISSIFVGQFGKTPPRRRLQFHEMFGQDHFGIGQRLR
jgi:hypothetical protein